jgi:hypothetical protein
MTFPKVIVLAPELTVQVAAATAAPLSVNEQAEAWVMSKAPVSNCTKNWEFAAMDRPVDVRE